MDAPNGAGRVIRGPSYVEFAPVPALTSILRTVWIQSTGDLPYVQRHLPSGGAELHWPLDGPPTLLGPLTRPLIEVIPAGTTIVGARFHPGRTVIAPGAGEELLDRRATVHDLELPWTDSLREVMGSAPSPLAALSRLQHALLQHAQTVGGDPLVARAVRLLMPWARLDVGTVAGSLGLSASQLRRRCLHVVGLGPKALQRTLRFQGLLALAQAGPATALAPTRRRGADGVAGLAMDVGYADQAHLGREVRRLSGLTPGELLGSIDACRCGHDHAASFTPFLVGRLASGPAGPARRARFVQDHRPAGA